MSRLVTHFGGVWKISEVSYTRLLRTIASCEPFELDGMATYLGNIDLNLTDLSPEEAESMLVLIRKRSRAAHRVSVRDAGPSGNG